MQLTLLVKPRQAVSPCTPFEIGLKELVVTLSQDLREKASILDILDAAEDRQLFGQLDWGISRVEQLVVPKNIYHECPIFASRGNSSFLDMTWDFGVSHFH